MVVTESPVFDSFSELPSYSVRCDGCSRCAPNHFFLISNDVLVQYRRPDARTLILPLPFTLSILGITLCI